MRGRRYYNAPPALRPNQVPSGDGGFVQSTHRRTVSDNVARFADVFSFWDWGSYGGDWRPFIAAGYVTTAVIIFGVGAAVGAVSSTRGRKS